MSLTLNAPTCMGCGFPTRQSGKCKCHPTNVVEEWLNGLKKGNVTNDRQEYLDCLDECDAEDCEDCTELLYNQGRLPDSVDYEGPWAGVNVPVANNRKDASQHPWHDVMIGGKAELNDITQDDGDRSMIFNVELSGGVEYRDEWPAR